MADETFQIEHENTGKTSTMTGEVVRFDDAARTRRAAVRAVGGLGLGALSVLIPVLHFFSTWMLPLIGAYLAWQAYNTRELVKSLRGPCPACGEEVQVDGGPLDGLRTVCPRCRENLAVTAGKQAGPVS